VAQLVRGILLVEAITDPREQPEVGLKLKRRS
jgi:hypothetical protein